MTDELPPHGAGLLVLAAILALAFFVGTHQPSRDPAPSIPSLPINREKLLRESMGETDPRFEPMLAEDPRQLEPNTGDLPALMARGHLRILVEGSEERFLPRAGMPAEEDRRVAMAFAKRVGLRAEFVLVSDFDQLIPMLNAGIGDLIVADMTVTADRAAEVLFTWPRATVSEMVVGRRGAPDLPQSASALAGREVHVRASSSYAETLRSLASITAPGLRIVPVPETMDAEQVVYEVSHGIRPLTVVDSHLLDAILTYNDQAEPLFSIADKRQVAWAVRRGNPELKAALDTFLMEQALNEAGDALFIGDLPELKARGVLRVLTRNNPISYYLHRGRQFGFDYELAKMAAEELGVHLEMVAPPTQDQLIPWLLEGRGDVVAATLAVTPERAKRVAFSTPYLFADEVLVQAAGTGPLQGLKDLKGKRIHLHLSSSAYETLTALALRYGPFELIPEPEEVETEELLDRVGRREIPYTVADSLTLQAELTSREDIEAALVLEIPPLDLLAPRGEKVGVAGGLEGGVAGGESNSGEASRAPKQPRGGTLAPGTFEDGSVDMTSAASVSQSARAVLEAFGGGSVGATPPDSARGTPRTLSVTDRDGRRQGSSQRAIAFGVRPNNPELRAYLDGFVARNHRGLRYNMAYTRYFEDERRLARAKATRARRTGQISPYDALIKTYSRRYAMDWRLMTAQAYQESHFNPRATSFGGAIGIFQVLPETGRAMGFADLMDPEEGIHAGIKYMSYLLAKLDQGIPFNNRVLFALAAYNAGLGHVLDARRIAIEEGLDPKQWFGNVEKTMLLLRKRAYYGQARYGYCRCALPVKYVSEIQRRYASYVKLFPR